jgi:hypothetical protein
MAAHSGRNTWRNKTTNFMAGTQEGEEERLGFFIPFKGMLSVTEDLPVDNSMSQ